MISEAPPDPATGHNFANRVGFIQGRLSPMVNGKIQAFPWDTWQAEFPLATRLGFTLMEWTLDHARLHENPFMTAAGRREIMRLMEIHRIAIPAVTGDCLMQAPFHKTGGAHRRRRLGDFEAVIDAAAALGTAIIVLPLVDGGAVDTPRQRDDLLAGLHALLPRLEDTGVRVAMETDLPPEAAAGLIAELPREHFGITYDIGNSAALGYVFAEEWAAYGDRVAHVHVKDRLLGGGTVALGAGHADLAGVLAHLARGPYRGDLMLQTARAEDGRHAETLAAYRSMVLQWLRSSGEGHHEP